MELLLIDPILCRRCIHRKEDEYTGEYCRMGMVKNLKRERCSEYIDKGAYVDNAKSKCYPDLFGDVYTALRRSDEKHEEFYLKFCKKCANRTGRNWCKRFARLTSELSR